MDDRYYMHEEARAAAERMIFLTGPARSGTTLMGKLLHSCEGVEYLFEPPMVAALLPLVEGMAEWRFRLLWEALVYEEILIGQITGRDFNLNSNDDSCIYTGLDTGEVQKRLDKVWRKEEAVEAARRRLLAVKFPDMTPFLLRLKALYPGMKIISMVRGAQSVINSLLRKAWLTDESLARRTLIWPSRNERGLTLPFWLKPSDENRWLTMRPVERAALYYCRIMEPLVGWKEVLLLSYDRLLEHPRRTLERMEKALGIRPTAKTDEILSTLHPATIPDEAWVNHLPADLKERVEEVEALVMELLA